MTAESPATDLILIYTAGMFASNHHSLVGSDEDPPDGGKVAAAVFSAVAVYGVRIPKHPLIPRALSLTKICNTGFPPILWMSSDYAQTSQQTRRDSIALNEIASHRSSIAKLSIPN